MIGIEKKYWIFCVGLLSWYDIYITGNRNLCRFSFPKYIIVIFTVVNWETVQIWSCHIAKNILYFSIAWLSWNSACNSIIAKYGAAGAKKKIVLGPYVSFVFVGSNSLSSLVDESSIAWALAYHLWKIFISYDKIRNGL